MEYSIQGNEVVLENGVKLKQDGSAVFPNGTTIFANGNIFIPKGCLTTTVERDNREKWKQAAGADKE